MKEDKVKDRRLDYHRPSSLDNAKRRPTFGYWSLLLPPAVAAASWPVGLITLGLFGPLLSFAVMLGCMRWAWSICGDLSGWLCSVRTNHRVATDPHNSLSAIHKRYKTIFFVAEVIAIVSTWPLTVVALRMTHIQVGVDV
jgi:hypothetical protein